ncbi:MAG: 3-isopropylmalate dehydratase, partial [Betaproteobacteria bacterium]
MEKTFSLTGRVLFLAEDPTAVERQLAGEDLTRAQAGPLRDNVSTDEITPTTRMLVFDDRLGRVPYVGLKCGDRFPIGDDAVRNGGFEVTVGGKRYGKGSSREHSPIAEKAAGIRLIVAENFERIYRQNCHNIGLLTTSDFGIVDRLQSGEAIPIEEFLAGQDPLTQKVILAGGLLAYTRAVA